MFDESQQTIIKNETRQFSLWLKRNTSSDAAFEDLQLVTGNLMSLW